MQKGRDERVEGFPVELGSSSSMYVRPDKKDGPPKTVDWRRTGLRSEDRKWTGEFTLVSSVDTEERVSSVSVNTVDEGTPSQSSRV